MWLFSRDPTKDFQYEIGDVIPGLENKSIWSIRKGKRKANDDPVTIFAFELKPGNESEFEVARGSLKRLKTLRHPNVVTYVDSLEADKVLYLVTEYVEPLEHHLKETSANSKQKSQAICWGLHQVIKGLSFLVNDCNLSHNNMCMSSIFVDKAGEWKIGGVEYMSSSDHLPIKTLYELQKYNPPEANDTGKRIINKWACDIWGYGCLIWEAYNGILPKSSSLKSFGKIPKNLQNNYCEFVSADQKCRPNPADFLSKARTGSGGYFNNSFIRSMLFLEEIQIKENAEKQRYFTNLATTLDDYPKEICKYKILPQLLNAFEFGNAGSSILGPLFKLSKLLDADEYQKSIVPCVVKLFSLKDRATRVKLLQQMDRLIDHLKGNVVNDTIFPQVVQGFIDTSPTIREETVKCMLHLAPKLNYNNLNVEMMKHFARIQSKDEQGGIRTNTTVCLGKIASNLHPQIRQKVLIPAFSRAMRDPFPAARIAGILALSACQCYFTLNDSASKVLPALCCLTTDPDKSVREQTFKTISGYLSKLESVSEDPSLAEEMEAAVNAGASSGITESAASWAGWAVSSLTSKFYKTSTKKPSATPEATNATKVPSTDKDENNGVVQLKIEKDNGNSRNSDSDLDREDWGSMEAETSSHGQQKTTTSAEKDGWDDTGWDDINPVPSESIGDIQTDGDGWSDGFDKEFSPVDPGMTLASSYNWSASENVDSDEFFSSITSSKKTAQRKPVQTSSSNNSSWSDWGSTDVPQADTSKAEMARKAREERKLQRQKELKEKRAARQAAMKLGDKQS